MPIGNEPWQEIAMDFVVALPNEYQQFDFPQTGSKLPNLTVAFNYLNRVIRAFIYSFGTDASESYFPCDSSLVSIPFRVKFLLIFQLQV